MENEQEMARRSGRKIYYILSLSIFLGLIVLGSVLLGPKILEAAKDPDKFKERLGGSGIKSYLIFIAIQFVQIIFAFIPGEFIEVGAGYVYGSIKGLILCLIGAFLATAVIFGLTRIFGKRFTEMIIGKKDLKKLKFLHDDKKLELIFALLYFIPGAPKDLLTYFAGVTNKSRHIHAYKYLLPHTLHHNLDHGRRRYRRRTIPIFDHSFRYNRSGRCRRLFSLSLSDKKSIKKTSFLTVTKKINNLL